MEIIEEVLEELWEHKRKLWLIFLMLFLFQLHYAYAYDEPKKETLKIETKEEQKEMQKEESKENESKKEEVVKNYYYIDIKGEVKKPGVYKVEEGKRVFEVLEQAGGILKDGDTTQINLSKKVEDEMVIYVRNKNTVDACEKITWNDESNNNLPFKQEKVSINHATKEELMTISGIGESKAIAIIEYRKEKPFETIEELLQVSGIGEKLFEQIKEYITL